MGVNYEWDWTRSVFISREQTRGGWLQMEPEGLGMIWKRWCWVDRRKHMGVGYEMESTTLSLGGH